MYHYQPDYNDDSTISISGKDYLYGDAWRDERFMRNPNWLPRYAHLARKIFIHYAGENYNPHKVLLADEYMLRVHIQDWINYRIQHRTPGYDWEWIDHFCRQYVGDIYDLDLKPDLLRIEQGFQPPYRGFIHDGNRLKN